MTGAEFLAYVKRVLKRTDKDTEIYESTTDVIADIRMQLKTEDYKENIAITGISTLGEVTLSLPSDFKHLIGDVVFVDDASGYTKVLNKISKQTYDIMFGDYLHSAVTDMNTGIPSSYCLYGNEILVGPVPDSISYEYYINYTTEDFAEITAVTADVPFSGKYRKILRYGVLADVYEGMEFFEEANQWRALYVDGLMKIKITDDKNVDDKECVAYHGF
jgi:hypothetical protein